MLRSLLLLCGATALSIASLQAQVPNGGFETWSNTGAFADPDNWVSTNYLAAQGTAMEPTCERGTPGAVGESYVKVTTRLDPSGTLIQGTVATGVSTTQWGGFPYVNRPTELMGQWQYGMFSMNAGLISVSLTRWDATVNARVVVGSGQLWATGTQSTWTDLHVPISYQSSMDPDSVSITIAASASPLITVAGSYIMVDDLRFLGGTGINEAENAAMLTVLPTLASDIVVVKALLSMSGIMVMDITGRPVMQQHVDGNQVEILVGGLSSGRYFMKVDMTDGTQKVRSFVKR